RRGLPDELAVGGLLRRPLFRSTSRQHHCRPGRSTLDARGGLTVPDHHPPFAAFVAEASQRFGIPAAWIRAVMHAESFGDMRAISSKGAIGLMQIMPETWAYLRQR